VCVVQTGSYKDKQPIWLRCDPVAPCRRIVLDHVDLKPAHKATHGAPSLCENAFGTASNVNPPVCLLREGGFSAMEATERARAATSVANTLSLTRRKESRFVGAFVGASVGLALGACEAAADGVGTHRGRCTGSL
jgi:hypothetical protein